MLIAAKTLACTGLDFISDPAALPAMQQEFAESRARFDYSPAVLPGDRPTLPSHMRSKRE
jgi:hypothetical protein